MDKKIYLKYCLKDAIKSNKKSTVIILIVISLLMIFIFSFKDTINNFFINGVQKDLGYRTLFVLRDDNLYSESEVIEQLKEINHVVEVFPDSGFFITTGIKSMDFSGTFSLTGVSQKTAPSITYGKMMMKENDIICPEKFYPDENILENEEISSNKFIDMKNYVGKEVTITYDKFIDETATKFETKKLKLNIVGTYKNNVAYIDENNCYAHYNLIKKTFDDAYEKVDMSSQVNSIMVQIDSPNNLNYVIKSINKLGHNVTQSLSFDSTLLNIINVVVYVVLIICFALSISIILYINNKEFNKKITSINILRSLGFRTGDIFKINYFEKNIFSIFIVVILFIILLLLFVGYKIIILIHPFAFSKIPISLNWLSIIISILMIFISLNISTYYFNKKINNSNIIEGLKSYNE